MINFGKSGGSGSGSDGGGSGSGWKIGASTSLIATAHCCRVSLSKPARLVFRPKHCFPKKRIYVRYNGCQKDIVDHFFVMALADEFWQIYNITFNFLYLNICLLRPNEIEASYPAMSGSKHFGI